MQNRSIDLERMISFTHTMQCHPNDRSNKTLEARSKLKNEERELILIPILNELLNEYLEIRFLPKKINISKSVIRNYLYGADGYRLSCENKAHLYHFLSSQPENSPWNQKNSYQHILLNYLSNYIDVDTHYISLEASQFLIKKIELSVLQKVFIQLEAQHGSRTAAYQAIGISSRKMNNVLSGNYRIRITDKKIILHFLLSQNSHADWKTDPTCLELIAQLSDLQNRDDVKQSFIAELDSLRNKRNARKRKETDIKSLDDINAIDAKRQKTAEATVSEVVADTTTVSELQTLSLFRLNTVTHDIPVKNENETLALS